MFDLFVFCKVVLFFGEIIFFEFSNVLFKLMVINFICMDVFFKNKAVLCSMFSFL